jgi:hypothetical protein
MYNLKKLHFRQVFSANQLKIHQKYTKKALVRILLSFKQVNFK